MTCLRLAILAILSLCIAQMTALWVEGRRVTLEPRLPADAHMVTIEAALGYNISPEYHNLLLFAGDQVQIVVNRIGKSIHNRELDSIPPKMRLQAAYSRPNDPHDRRFFGDKYGINTKFGEIQKRFKYGPNRKFMKKGGPDAAGKRGGIVYFFKGCEMVVRKSEGKWGKIKKVDSVGLPCDIDAAWEEYDNMMVLKGDQCWVWKSDGSVDGPYDFHGMFRLIDWTLRPANTTT